MVNAKSMETQEIEIDVEIMYELVMNELVTNHPEINKKPSFWWYNHKWEPYQITNLTT